MEAKFTEDGKLIIHGNAQTFAAGDGHANFSPKVAAIIAAGGGAFSVYSTDDRGHASEDAYTLLSVQDGVATFRVTRRDFKVRPGRSLSSNNDSASRV